MGCIGSSYDSSAISRGSRPSWWRRFKKCFCRVKPEPMAMAYPMMNSRMNPSYLNSTHVYIPPTPTDSNFASTSGGGGSPTPSQHFLQLGSSPPYQSGPIMPIGRRGSSTSSHKFLQLGSPPPNHPGPIMPIGRRGSSTSSHKFLQLGSPPPNHPGHIMPYVRGSTSNPFSNLFGFGSRPPNQSAQTMPCGRGGGLVPSRSNFLLGLGLPRGDRIAPGHGPNCPVDYCCNDVKPNGGPYGKLHQRQEQGPLHTCGRGQNQNIFQCCSDLIQQSQQQQPRYPGRILAPHYHLHNRPFPYSHPHRGQRQHTHHNNPFLHHHAQGPGVGSQYHGQGYIIAHHNHHHHVNFQ